MSLLDSWKDRLNSYENNRANDPMIGIDQLETFNGMNSVRFQPSCKIAPKSDRLRRFILESIVLLIR